MCIKEASRLHNPVIGTTRALDKPTTVDGKFLPAGTQVETQLHSLHHNPQVWGEDHMVSQIWSNQLTGPIISYN